MSDSHLMMRVRQQEPGEVCEKVDFTVPVPERLWKFILRAAAKRYGPGSVIQAHCEIRASAFVVSGKIDMQDWMKEEP